MAVGKSSSPVTDSEGMSVSIRKIDNGYLVTKQDDSSYTQTFSANRPKLVLDAPTEASVKAPTKKVRPDAVVKAGGPKPKSTVKAS